MIAERLNAAQDLIDQAESLALMAEEAEIVVRHFKPRYQECWDNDGRLFDGKTAGQLRHFVVDRSHEAERYRREEYQLREAARMLIDG